MGNGKRAKKPKRRVIENKPPIAKSSRQRIRELQDHFNWVDREEERLLAEQANG